MEHLPQHNEFFKRFSVPLTWRLIGTILLISTFVRADVTLPPIFGDHMVLQQGVTLPVWGLADPGESVSVRFGKCYQETRANGSGRWRVTLPPLPTSMKSQCLIISGKNRFEIQDVILGDVWVCAGGGSMSIPLSRSLETLRERSPFDDQIRVFFSDSSLDPQHYGKGRWVVSSSFEDCKASLSAVGYYFARDLTSSQHLAIGMIQCTRDAGPLTSWIPTNKIGSGSKRPASLKQPSAFNELISPIIPFSISGVIWSDGQTLPGEGALTNRSILPRLIRNWRKEWAQGSFPFYLATPVRSGDENVSPVDHYQENGGAVRGFLPWVREAMAGTLKLPATGMAVADDLVDSDDSSSQGPLLIGRRLALLARHLFYAEEISDSGPECQSISFEKNKVRVSFETHGSHLTLAMSPVASQADFPKISTSLKGFALRGEGGKWFPAQGRIVGESVILSSDSVPSPKAVRYNWKDSPEGNLYDLKGLPARSFRSDSDQPIVSGNL